MLRWVNKKTINFEKTREALDECIESHHFSNFGKYVGQLEDKLQEILKIDDSKKVLAVCNGACGLTALIGAMNVYHKKELKFLVQGFTFPCSKQTLLMGSRVVDIDCDLYCEDLDSFDGIIVTNCFGHCNDIDYCTEFCEKNNKILLFDNAASPYTFYKGSNISNYGDGAMISLHHTKPIGFGEGGIVIVDAKYYDILKKIICFGYSPEDKYNYSIYASNYKMSEVSAIHIIQWLDHFDDIVKRHQYLYQHFEKTIKEMQVELFNNCSDHLPFTSCLPVLFYEPVDIQYFIDRGIEAKKYYYPLSEECKTGHDIFARIVCFPLHNDMTAQDIDRIVKLIKSRCV